MSGTKEFNTITQKSSNKIDGIKPVQQNIFNAAVNNKPEPVKTKTSPNKSLSSENNPKTPDIVVPPSEPKTNPKTANNLLTKSLDFGKTLVDSLAYNAYESPMLGLSQIVKTATNVNIEKYLPQVKAVDPGKFGTSNWYASQIGSGLGIALDFIVANKLMGSKITDLAGKETFNSTSAKIITQSAISGAIYEGVFSPSNLNANHDNLLSARLKQAFSGALTFGAMAGISNGLGNLTASLADKNILAKAVSNNLVNGIVSGSIGGIVNVNTDSLLNNGHLASFKNDVQTAYAYSVAGIPLGLAHVFDKPNVDESSLNHSLNHPTIKNEILNNDLAFQNMAHTSINDTYSSQTTDLSSVLPNVETSFVNNNEITIKSIAELTKGFDKAKDVNEIIKDSNGKQVAKLHFKIPRLSKLPDIAEYTKPELLDKIKTADFRKSKSVLLDNGVNLFINDRGVINAWFKDGAKLKLDLFDKVYDYSLTLPDGTEVDKTKFGDNHELYTYSLLTNQTVAFRPGHSLDFSDQKDAESRITIYNNGDLHLDYYKRGQYLGTLRETKLEEGTKTEINQNNIKFTRYPNGNTEAILDDGTEINNYQGNNITTYPNGLEIAKLNDGSIKSRNLTQDLNDSIAKIVAKFNSDHFNQAQYEAILNKFNENTKPLAQAILDLSLPNMSIRKFMDSVILTRLPSEIVKPERLIVKSASSSGNAIAYLYRKALGMDASIVPLDDIDPKANYKAIYFDSLENLDSNELAKLKSYNAATDPHNFSIFDANNFDKGINFLDVAKDSIYPKLKQLVIQARKVQLTLPDGPFLTPNEIADVVLNKNNNIIARENYLKLTRPIPQSTDILLTPPVTDQNIIDFLDNQEYKTYNAKLVASSFLANDAQFYNVRTMLDRAKTLYAAIGHNIEPMYPQSLNSLLSKTKASFDYLNPEIDYPALKSIKFVVGLDGTHGAGSSAFVNYIFKMANNIDDTKFLSRANLEDYLNYNEDLPKRSIVLLDDTAYSGNQIEETILNHFEQHKDKLVIGLYGAYRDFEKNLRQSADQNPGLEPNLVVLESHLPIENTALDKVNSHSKQLFKTTNGNFNEMISQITRSNALRHLIDDSTAFEDINSFQIWPYMTPDTSLNLVRNFGHFVLGFN